MQKLERMQSLLLIAGIFLFCATTAGIVILHGKQIGINNSARHPVRLLRVIDGDTVAVLFHGQEERVRLLRINTPERGHPGYASATAHLRTLTANPTLELEFENKIPERDRFGRILGYLWAEGKNLNIEQVRAGYSRFWAKYGAGRYAEDFRKVEAESAL